MLAGAFKNPRILVSNVCKCCVECLSATHIDLLWLSRRLNIVPSIKVWTPGFLLQLDAESKI